MATYLYCVTTCSAAGTPLRSDTLYGHLLCAARELDGENALGNLVGRFKEGRPPFILSSAFPAGMLPMPVLPNIPRADFQRFARERTEFGGSMFRALEKYKDFKKIKWLPVSLWVQLSVGFSQERLFAAYLDNLETGTFAAPAGKTELELHNTIDRQRGTVLAEGGLYTSEAAFYLPGTVLEMYVQTDDPSTFERYLEVLAKTGYGRDRSTGKGSFTFRRDDGFDPSLMAGSGNALMSLSVCSHQNLSTIKGYYSVFTKYGKVWNGFGQNNPFKKPFLAFAEGSVFQELPADGYILQGIHSDPKIVQITWPLTLPLTLEVS